MEERRSKSLTLICPLCEVVSTVTPRCRPPDGVFHCPACGRDLTLGLRDGRELGLRR